MQRPGTEPIRRIQARLHMEHPWLGGTNVCSVNLGHIAVTPTHDTKASNIFFFSITKISMSLKSGIIVFL